MNYSIPRTTARQFKTTKQQHINHHQSNNWFRLPKEEKQNLNFNQLRQNDPILFPNNNNLHQTNPFINSSSFNPPNLQQPLHYFPHLYNNNLPPPRLSSSIASLHNAALVYLHRGLAIHSIQLNSKTQTNKLDHQEPFLSAVIKGFNQILELETGLEFSQSRQVMESLIKIVREKLDITHHQDQIQQEEIWNHSKYVIIHSALRPRMSCVGDWAWDEIKRGNFNRLIQVWTGILQVLNRKPDPHHHPQIASSSQSKKITIKTIGLDEQFFTALVIVSSTIENGPKLSELVQSLVNRVWSRVQASDQLNLEGIVPNPDRARYFLRAIELGLIWKKTSNPANVIIEGVEQEGEEVNEQDQNHKSIEQDERIVHLIRRTFLNQRHESIQFCIDLSKRIQEAVQGFKNEPGWLPVDWSEPTPTSSAEGHPNKSDQSNEPLFNKFEQITLTQKVVSILLSGFAENGLISEVDELIRFSRQLGGMNLYLWTSILRGSSKLKKPDLMKEYLNRMKVEDGIEIDFNIRCILISASIGTSDLEHGIESIDELISLSESFSKDNQLKPQYQIIKAKTNRENKLPIEAINSILSALLQNKLLDKAERLLKNLSGRIEPNTTTLNHFLKYHSRLNSKLELNLELVLNHLKMFEEVYSIKPDVISFTILLNILMKLGFSSNLIEKLLLMMKSMNIQPNAITYGSIIHHLCRSGKSRDVHVALNLLNHIEQNRIATTEITYTALIQGFLRAHIQDYESKSQGIHQINQQEENETKEMSEINKKTNLEQAIELISRLKSRSINLNLNNNNNDKMKSSSIGFNDIINNNQGGKINQVIYNSLLNALFSTAEYETGFQVFKLMKSEYDIFRKQQEKNQIYQRQELNNNKEEIDFYYYGNGFIDSYGIIFRRLIQFGQFDLFHFIYFNYFKFENFHFIPIWIQKLIDKFEKSQF